MGERSGSLGNSGFDTRFFYLALSGVFFFSLIFWGSTFTKLASQSVFICEDDHMLYDFGCLAKVADGLLDSANCEFWSDRVNNRRKLFLVQHLFCITNGSFNEE